MLNQYITACLITLSTIGYSQEFNTQFGSVKYKMNPDNTISYLGSNFHYKFKDFAQNLDISAKSTIYNLSYNNGIFVANFTNTTGENQSFVYSLKLKDFTFANQQNIKSFSYSHNDTQLNYVSAENPIIFKDYWNRNIATKNYLSINTKQLYGNFSNDYYAVNFDSGFYKIIRAHSTTQSENDLQYKDSTIFMKLVNFDDAKNQKDFIDISTKIFSLKCAKDIHAFAQMITFGNTTLAHDNNQNYVQSKVGEFSYKLAQNENKINYGFTYKGLSYNDKQWFFMSNLNKNLLVQIGSDGKIHAGNYDVKIKDTNISLKYTDKFDVYDFYFNQGVFSVYDNSFNMIGDSKTQYKNSTSIVINNPQYSFNIDAINDLWNLNFKANKEFNLAYLKDQKNNHISLSDVSKYGTITLGYNLDKDKIDRLGVNFNYKF
jgi:hypothetical protein